MAYHFQKRWRLRFRRDPDAGRVLFIGPLVLSLDVRSGFNPRMSWRADVLQWMEKPERQWHCNRPRIHHFWEWVVMPRGWGGRYGLRSYIRWATRREAP